MQRVDLAVTEGELVFSRESHESDRKDEEVAADILLQVSVTAFICISRLITWDDIEQDGLFGFGERSTSGSARLLDSSSDRRQVSARRPREVVLLTSSVPRAKSDQL